MRKRIAIAGGLLLLAMYGRLYLEFRSAELLVHGRVIHNDHAGSHYIQTAGRPGLRGAALAFYPLANLEMHYWYRADPFPGRASPPLLIDVADPTNGLRSAPRRTR